tara:strand:+ start:785 stop:889 length:105 start_codon:yes stop_codon:yes gene_type:complete
MISRLVKPKVIEILKAEAYPYDYFEQFYKKFINQ